MAEEYWSRRLPVGVWEASVLLLLVVVVMTWRGDKSGSQTKNDLNSSNSSFRNKKSQGATQAAINLSQYRIVAEVLLLSGRKLETYEMNSSCVVKTGLVPSALNICGAMTRHESCSNEKGRTHVRMHVES